MPFMLESFAFHIQLPESCFVTSFSEQFQHCLMSDNKVLILCLEYGVCKQRGRNGFLSSGIILVRVKESTSEVEGTILWNSLFPFSDRMMAGRGNLMHLPRFSF
jgi:hypothetical protein